MWKLKVVYNLQDTKYIIVYKIKCNIRNLWEIIILVQNPCIPKYILGPFDMNDIAWPFLFRSFTGMYPDKTGEIFSLKAILIEGVHWCSLNILFP